VPTPSHRSSSATLALEQPGRDRDRTQGCLAAWYRPRRLGRNEFTKLPFVAFHHGPLKPGASSIGGTLIVRNRCPSDILVECLRVTEPDGARLCFQSGPAVQGRVPTVKRRARTLEWRLPGFGSGEFPSKTDWFEIDLARDPAAAFVEIEVVIMFTRRMMFSRRFTKRHRIRRGGKRFPP
jgi:hypothetical protein